MSAKRTQKGKGPTPAAVAPASVAAAPIAQTAAGAAEPAATTVWIDSSDPRKRMIGKAVLTAVWLYVAALWLLALDQTFQWGIFGPKVPPVP